MAATRISHQVDTFVAAAIERHGMGESITYDVGVTVVPTAPDQFQPALVVVITIPDTSNLGSRLVGSGLMDMAITEEYADRFVAQTLETLRSQRSAALTAVPLQNGNGAKKKTSWDDLEGLSYDDAEKRLRGGK